VADAQTRSLVVPVDLQGLLVGNDDVGNLDRYGTGNFAQLRPHFEQIAYFDENGNLHGTPPPIAQQLLARAFDSASGADALQPGVHLHWALPDALTHASAGDDGPLTFPHAPDRWVVVRTVATPANGTVTLTRRGWVLEGNALTPPQETPDPDPSLRQSPTVVPYVPQPNEHPAPFRAMGTAAPLETYTPGSGPYAFPHTALGYGHVAFAATYAFAQNVFGFWDPCDDLDPLAAAPGRTLSYAVIGWYADPAKSDPVAALAATSNTPKDFVAALQSELQWTYDARADTQIPQSSVLLGVLGAVPGDLTQQYVMQRNLDVQVAVGNTTAEAFSALLARALGGQYPEAERILTLLQTGALQRFHDRNTIASSDEALHRAEFSAFPGGTLWSVVRTADPAQSATGTISRDQLAGVANASILNLDPSAGALLTDLNAKQVALDAAVFADQTARAQLFADWIKMMIVEHPGDIVVPYGLTGPAAATFLRGEVAACTAAQGDIAQRTTAVTAAHDTLAAVLAPAFEPVAQAAPRFYAPHDPVVVLAGAATDPDPRYGGDGRFANGLLQCRRDDVLLSGLTYGGSSLDAAGAAVGLPAVATLPFVRALVADAAFGDAALAPWLAQQLGVQGGQLPAAIAAIEAAQTASPPAGGTAVLTGTFPSPVGLQQWTVQPFIPLFLEWEAEVSPVVTLQDGNGDPIPYDPAAVTSRYTLTDADTELVPRAGQPLPPIDQTRKRYSGTMPLASSIDTPLVRQAKSYLEDAAPDDPVVPLLQAALQLKLPVMAQALQGFTQTFLQRMQVIQLPVNDPLAGSPRELELTQAVSDLVQGYRSLSADPQLDYNPLRAGLARFSQLRIVDVYGQTNDVNVAYLIPSEALDAGDQNDPSTLALPPRLAPPARLDAQLIAANGATPTNAIPTTTPIFGWLVYNHVDDNLLVYDGAGLAAGSFNVRGPLWLPPPGTNVDPQPASADLANFIAGVQTVADPRAYVQALMGALDLASQTITSPKLREDPSLALLVSRPFALARARFGLNYCGGTPLDQGWQAFAAAVAAPGTARADAALHGLQFGVELGDVTSGEDGFVGYYLDGDGAGDFATLNAPDPRMAAGTHVRTPAAETLPVDAQQARDAIVLFDPHCTITATTGVLPVVTLQLPPEHYVPALQRLAVTFGVTPLIRNSVPLAIPHPAIRGYDWSWLTLGASTETQTWSAEDAPDDSQTGTIPSRTIVLQEGWLALTPDGSSS